MVTLVAVDQPSRREVKWYIQRVADLIEAAPSRVRWTHKARTELQENFPLLLREDAEDALAQLEVRDFDHRLESESTGEEMWVFKTEIGDDSVWVKLIMRDNCVVISFHDGDQDG